jgi:hypothetical protein
MPPHLMPVFKELAQEAYEAYLIRQSNLAHLAKFSLSFFAEMWLQQELAHSRHREQ